MSAEDEAEVFALVSRIVSGAKLAPERIVSAWSGVRPLVRPEGAGPDTVELSRSHRVVENQIGVLGLVGGKLTTYRQMAEDAVDEIGRRTTL